MIQFIHWKDIENENGAGSPFDPSCVSKGIIMYHCVSLGKYRFTTLIVAIIHFGNICEAYGYNVYVHSLKAFNTK